MAIYPKWVLKCKVIPMKISAGFFVEMEKLIRNSYGNKRTSE
jgi:hypothetical protein